MNPYYHEFSVGFNWWMVVGAIMVIVAIIAGVMQSYLTAGLKIKRRYNERLFALISTFGAIVFGIMLFFESGDGILQWLDNHLSLHESGALSLFFFGPALVGVAIFFFSILYGVANFASWTKEGFLCAKRREIIREEKEEEREKQAEQENKHGALRYI